jgi:hypothetical protein
MSRESYDAALASVSPEMLERIAAWARSDYASEGHVGCTELNPVFDTSGL